MTVLVVGLSHRTAPVVGARAGRRAGRRRPQGARRAASRGEHDQRGDAALHLQPGRGLRGRRRASTAASPTSPPCSRGTPAWRSTELAEHLYVHYDEAAVSTCSRSPPGSTRWWSARRRSSASCATPTRAATEADTVGRCCTSSCSRRCGSASGCTPRPASTGPGASVVRSALGRRRARARRARRPAGAGRRRGLDGRAGRGHAAPARRRPSSSSPTAAAGRRAAGRRRSNARRPARSTLAGAAGRARRSADLRRRRPPARSAAGRATASATVRPARRPPAGRARPRRCRATSTRPSAPLPGVHYVDLDALRSAGCRRQRSGDVDAAQRDRRRGGARPTSPPAAAADVAPTVTALRARADRGGRRRAGPAGRPAARASTRRRAREVAAHVHRVGREAAARPDRPGQAAGRHARRRPVRRGAARAVRPRPGARRGRVSRGDVPTRRAREEAP